MEESSAKTNEPVSLKQVISDNLFFLLDKNDLTQEKLAQLSGVPKGTISNIVGKRVAAPTVPIIKKLANALNVTIEQIIDKPLSDYDYFIHVNRIHNGSFPKIPILNWLNTEQMIEDILSASKDKLTNDWLNFNTLPEKGWLFALRSKSSYLPKFPANSYLIFNHNATPIDDTYALVQCKNKLETSLIHYFFDGNNEYMTSIYEDKKIIIEPGQIKLLGVLFVIKFDLE